MTPGSSRRHRWLVALSIAASAVFFFTRLFRQVREFAVDVPYLDQWDVLNPWFWGWDPWRTFAYQHGPHRQGLGSLVVAASNALTGWDMRYLGFVNVCLLGVALLLALWLKHSTYGGLTFWDCLLPPLFFRSSQYEALVMSPNPSHGVIPLVLVLSIGLALTMRARTQLFVLPILGFFAAFTGFAGMVLPVLLVLLATRGLLAWRGGDRAAARLTWTTMVLLVGLASTFLVGYRPGEIERSRAAGLQVWLDWPVVMVNRFYGLSGTSVTLMLLGIVAFVVPALYLVIRLWTPAGRRSSPRWWIEAAIPTLLVGYSVTFALASALGRGELGLAVADSSRYVTHMVPFALGLHFSYQVLRGSVGGRSFRMWLTNALGLILVLGSVVGAFALTSLDRMWIEQCHTGKLRWVKCMSERVDAVNCETRVGFAIHPIPESIDERAQFLKDRRLSFYSDDDAGRRP